jgi:hypothetical protein
MSWVLWEAELKNPNVTVVYKLPPFGNDRTRSKVQYDYKLNTMITFFIYDMGNMPSC